uniref:Uncharacterized protein n=1 Tax=Arundo donax TaxID=35708 RepID=A0A0A8YZJ2_ARUDO
MLVKIQFCLVKLKTETLYLSIFGSIFNSCNFFLISCLILML